MISPLYLDDSFQVGKSLESVPKFSLSKGWFQTVFWGVVIYHIIIIIIIVNVFGIMKMNMICMICIHIYIYVRLFGINKYHTLFIALTLPV